ncbi:hypothetical protein WN943_025462 [Citrus x changshan-huyou]
MEDVSGRNDDNMPIDAQQATQVRGISETTFNEGQRQIGTVMDFMALMEERLEQLSKIELAEENKTSSNKKSREVEARGAGSKKRIFRGMKKKKDIAREMRRLAMDLGVRKFYVYVDFGDGSEIPPRLYSIKEVLGKDDSFC